MKLLIKLILLFIFGIILLTFCKPNKTKELSRDEVFTLFRDATYKTNTSGNCVASFRKADSIFRNTKHLTVWHKLSFYSIGCWMNETLGKNDLAAKYADSCVDAIKDFGINEATATDYSLKLLEKGLVNIKLGNYDIAYKSFFDAKQAINLVKDSCFREDPLDCYGRVLYQQREYDLAKNAFVEELGYFKNCYIGDQYKQYGKKQNILNNIALCYTKLNKLDSAKMYYFKAIEVIEADKKNTANPSVLDSLRYKTRLGVVFGNLAKTYIPSNLDSASSLYKKAIELNSYGTPELGDAQLCMFQLADVQLQQHKYEDGFTTLKHLRTSLDTFKNESAELGYKQSLYNYYSVTNQYQQAFDAHKNYIALRDSIKQKETGINTTNINKELRDREQQLQIQLLQKDKNISNLYLWIIAAALFIAAIIAIMIYRNYKKSKEKNIQLVDLNNQITHQQKETEYALQQLEVSNKDKDRILRVVAHDLRNPIGAIASLSHLMMEQEDDEPVNKEVVQMIESTSNQSLTLINELLQVHSNNNELLNLQETNLNSLLQQTVAVLQHKAKEKKQTLELHLPNHTINLQLDAYKMDRVFSNLINNAIKFSHQQSTIKIILSQAESIATVAIQDNGIGISQEHQEQMFDKFGSIRQDGTAGEKSFGLGLSICKQIVDAHNGKIWVESEAGKGSCFYVQLSIS